MADSKSDLKGMKDRVERQASEPTPGPSDAALASTDVRTTQLDPGPNPDSPKDNVKGPVNEKMDAPRDEPPEGFRHRSPLAAEVTDDTRAKAADEAKAQVMSEGRNQNTSLGRNSENDQ